MQSDADVTSFFARRKIIDTTASSTKESQSAAELEDGYDLLSFLAAAQSNDVDFLPITWEADLGKVGAGGTSQIQQSFLNLDLSYVFKRIHRGIDEPYAFRALVSEIAILGHKDIRGHPNIVRLIGVTWDILSASEAIWPTLVFRKSEHGDLRRFMKSDAGKGLDFDGRLKLCNDLAVGIAALHAVGVVHGDIKPMNILIFSDGKDKETVYTAQLGDFGYSTMTNKELENAKDIHLPISWPWNAPEVSSWEISFPTHEAKLTDIFSLGFVFSWLLFPDELLEMGVDVERPSLDVGWKDGGNLEQIASSAVDKQLQLPESRRAALKKLFASTLATDPKQRKLDIQALVKSVTAAKAAQPQIKVVPQYEAWMPYMRWIPNHKSFDVEAVQDAYYGSSSSYSNPYASAYTSQNPYAIYDSRAAAPRNHMRNATKAPKPQASKFLVWKSFRQLVQSDYRTWTVIFNALKNKVSGPGLEEKQSALFQLAFCYEIGFGTMPDSSKVADYLEQGCRTQEDLLREIKILKEDKNPLVFKNLETEIGGTDRISGYLKTTELTDVQSAYSPIAEASNRLFGEDHRTSTFLNRILGSTFLAKGEFSRAQTIFTRLASVCEEHYGSKHPDTLGCLLSIAECHIAQGNIEQAKEIVTKVVDLQKNMHSSTAQDRVPTMQRLASIYREQQRWKEAEELEWKILETNERSLGKCHTDTLVAISALVENYKHQGSLAEAQELARELVDRSVGQFGEGDTRALDSMDLLVSIYMSRGNFDAALELANRTTGIRTRTLSPDHQDITSGLLALVKAQAGAGDLEKAVEIQREAVGRNKRTHGESHRYTLGSLELLATLLAKQQRYGEAIEAMTSVVAHRQHSQGDSDPGTVASIGTLEEYKKQEASAKAQDRLAAFIEKTMKKNAD
ncbi:hypothetical protein TWF696_000404 [Orbilia brochopaga]|uniref:Protein kinase domain-containing protein n=1 Tax=Orbilia brochopaga TaxID=3140254 RepID=A0AAV9VB98_9PEZI